jgi:hypothetical protein
MTVQEPLNPRPIFGRRLQSIAAGGHTGSSRQHRVLFGRPQSE